MHYSACIFNIVPCTGGVSENDFKFIDVPGSGMHLLAVNNAVHDILLKAHSSLDS